MKISRLDEIINRYVANSSIMSDEKQIVSLLQDISETVAMIYDKMCGNSPVSITGEFVSTMAFIIPFGNLKEHDSLHFEHIEFPEGYEVSFIRYEEDETIDVKRNEKRIEKYAVVDAFGSEMRLAEEEYNKKWRCWNMTPTKEERGKAKWIK